MKKAYLKSISVTVEVPEPPSYYGYDDEKRERFMRGRADEIASEIRRHVDGLGRHDVFMTPDVVHVCSHCDSHWSEDSAIYNGGCCSKDEEAPITP